MNAELFIHVLPDEMSIGLVEDKKLVELRKEKRNLQYEVGDIYLGKVHKIMPGLNAAFINVGYEKDAFLHYQDLGCQFLTQQKFLQQVTGMRNFSELPRVKREADIEKKGEVSNVLKPGDEVLVQIAKEPISTKGPRLTCEISLAGRNIVLMPFCEKISVSKRIRQSAERTRLKNILQNCKQKEMGVIIRTVAEGASAEEITTEYNQLYNRWVECIKKVREVRPPGLVLSEMERANTMLRDLLNPSFNKIYVDDEKVYTEVTAYVEQIDPEKKQIVELYKGEASIFDYFGLTKQIRQSCGRTVSFKNGAYLIIETTEALNVIDVNSGNKSRMADDQENNALEVNLAAADEIARQLRLRDMGGIVVVDFIDMASSEHRTKLYERMKQAMAPDKTKHNILPLSKFGLMQITRQRVRPVMTIDTTEVCPTCMGKGKIETSVNLPDQILMAIKTAIDENPNAQLTVTLNPYVYAYLKKGFPSQLFKWKWQYFKNGLRFLQSHALAIVDYKVTDRTKVAEQNTAE